MCVHRVQQTEPMKRGIKRGKTVLLKGSPYLKELQRDLDGGKENLCVRPAVWGWQGQRKGQGEKESPKVRERLWLNMKSRVKTMCHVFIVMSCIQNREEGRCG